MTHALPEIKKEGQKHEAEYNFDLLGLLGISQNGKYHKTFLPVSQRAQISFEELLKHHEITREKPWVILSPGASCPSKRWPAERFGYLTEKIKQRHDVLFLAIGCESDRQHIESLQRVTSEKIYDLSGRLTMGMLAALLRDAALLVSNDSGPVHVASNFETPVISIFGRNLPGLSPKRWGPLGKNSRILWKDVGCENCLAHDCEINFLCLDVISINDVINEVEFFSDFLIAIRILGNRFFEKFQISRRTIGVRTNSKYERAGGRHAFGIKKVNRKKHEYNYKWH